MSESTILTVGSPAPSFSRPANGGRVVSLSDFVDKQPLILYFYPKDDTPGCTKESCGFRDLASEFAELGIAIVGVSLDSVKSHEKFAQKHRLPFPLLSDEDASMSTQFGVYKEKSLYGRRFMGIERTTFVIGKDGKIKAVFPKVRVEGHVEKVLATIDNL